MSAKPSRQRIWQLKQKESGLCVICAKPTQGRVRCDPCSAKHDGPQRRYRLKSAWQAVDWSEPVATIALRMGVTAQTAYYQRRKRTRQKNSPAKKPASNKKPTN